VKKRTAFSVVPWYFTIPSLIGLALILGPLLGPRVPGAFR